MSPPAAAKVAKQASFAISAPSMLVLILLAVFAYILFAGGDKSQPSQDSSNTGAYGEPNVEHPDGSGMATNPNLTIDPYAASPTSSTDGADHNALRSFTPNPDRWRDERYDPTTLRPVQRPPTPTRSALRGRNAQSRPSRRVQIPATPDDEIVHTHRDDLMRGGGHQEQESWKDWKADPETEWNPAPPDPPEHNKRYRIKQDIDQSRASILFAGYTLAPDMVQRISQLEKVARQDGRGVNLVPIRWDRNGQTLPPNAADDLVSHTDDPMADNWDDVWGSLPILGMRAAEQVARVISTADINELAELMVARQDASVTDSKRDWHAFVQRAAPNDGGKLDQARLTMGWFADTYRSVSHPARMCISHQFVNMMEKIPLVANGLQWLEAIAWHLRRQRMLGPLGVDIHGLALRLAVPCTVLKDPPPGTNRYRYDLELHVFMWGGPKDGGEDGMRDWLSRLRASAGCLRSTRTDLAQILYELKEPDTAIDSACKRRRLIFRPGYTAYGVNNSNFDAVDRNKALRGAIAREPEVVTYPDDYWSQLKYDVDDSMRKLLVGFYPHEAGIFNSRQYQWNTSTLTAENNKLHDQHLLVILRALGPAMDPDSDSEAGAVITLNHTVEFLDFGSFIPLIKAREGHRFFPLKAMYALSGIVIPFLPSSRTDRSRAGAPGATAHVLLDPSYGIREQLGGRKISNGGGEFTEGHLTVFVTVHSRLDGDRLRRDITQYLQDAARQIIADAAPSGSERNIVNAARRGAREEIGKWIDKHLSNVCIVDESTTSESQKLQGNLRYLDWEQLHILGPDRWPTEFQDV